MIYCRLREGRRGWILDSRSYEVYFWKTGKVEKIWVVRRVVLHWASAFGALRRIMGRIKGIIAFGWAFYESMRADRAALDILGYAVVGWGVVGSA